MADGDDNANDGDGPPPLAPCGQGDYIVSQGECISTIAIAAGFTPDKVWNDGANAELRNARKDPNVLLPEDKVTLPKLTPKSESKATGASYKFKRKGVPLKLNLQMLDEARKPRANLHYTLYVGSKTLQGNTDGNGYIHESIPVDASSARLVLNNGSEVHELSLGYTNPIDDLSGIQSRLQNLAFYYGSIDGQFGDDLRQAIEEFQAAYGLPVNGNIDDATKQKLKSIHGS